MTLIISKEQDGMTVLNILRSVVGLSGGMIRHIKFLNDGIILNSERVSVRRVVHTGDILELNTSDNNCSSNIEGFDLPLGIIYEDEDIVIPDKPPFMPTHPSHNHHNDTVANALAFRYTKAGEPFVFRPVNRLDRNTSGLLIIARNRTAAGRLSRSMLEGGIHKKYIAVLDGVLKDNEGTIETYMRRTAESVIVREVCAKEQDADYALTKYKVLLRSDKNTVVLAEPITGRTHQLRVHFASLGAPITGDDLYGLPSPHIERHALHAANISLPHPTTKEQMSFFAPLHKDMELLVKKLFPNKDLKNEIEDKIR